MRILVLGAGLQGSACAFDLLNSTTDVEVRLADVHLDHLPHFLAEFSGERLIPTPLDVRDHAAVEALMRECDGVACALPYYLNLGMSVLAIRSGAHFCDLGGNTELVQKQKALHEKAVEARVSIIPDCGLAPGMVNILAQDGIDQLDSTTAVRMFVGGLPQDPQPPLNYQIVYSIEGMLDYYTTKSWLVRNGRRMQMDALSELETVEFTGSPGRLEAFHTAGGLSTMAERYAGRIQTMEYKTLRYPGHAVIMKAVRDLGLLDTAKLDVDGTRVAPRDVFIAAAGPHLRHPDARDLVALRVVVEGLKNGSETRVTYELIDLHDSKRGISAMMRTTGYSLAITALMQASGEIAEPGVHTPDECVPTARFLQELSSRNISVAVGLSGNYLRDRPGSAAPR
jgi:lysine 6-dehydrogenase